MATYYIDYHHGDNSLDGLSPDRARKDYLDLPVKPGDSVLFRRGSFIRGMLKSLPGEPAAPITYGAYGEGEKPIFCGSMDITDEKLWEKVGENIWKYSGHIPTETGNMIYNGGALFGTLRFERDELSSQGDFYDSRFGITHPAAEGYCKFKDTGEVGDVLIYSAENPGKYYSSIECAPFLNGRLAIAEHDTVFADLCFVNSGVHGICGSGINIVIRDCEFKNIGGAVIRKERRLRFGNGVEFWEICEGCTVEGCIFDNIYDSGITHQGKLNETLPKNNTFDNNIFHRCGMAAYECRDFIPQNTSFSYNVCDTAGEGFSALGENMPRFSEIWPLPMGHHVFIWRIRNKTDGSSLTIKGNKFLSAKYGGAIFALGVPEMYSDYEVEDNGYSESEMLLTAYLTDKEYKTLDDFKKAYGMDTTGYIIK